MSENRGIYFGSSTPTHGITEEDPQIIIDDDDDGSDPEDKFNQTLEERMAMQRRLRNRP